jgi:hypothetical protein
MSRLGFEPGPPAWEASTLEKSHLDSLSTGYSEPLLSRHLLTTFGPLQANICKEYGKVSLNKVIIKLGFLSHSLSLLKVLSSEMDQAEIRLIR